MFSEEKHVSYYVPVVRLSLGLLLGPRFVDCQLMIDAVQETHRLLSFCFKFLQVWQRLSIRLCGRYAALIKFQVDAASCH